MEYGKKKRTKVPRDVLDVSWAFLCPHYTSFHPTRLGGLTWPWEVGRWWRWPVFAKGWEVGCKMRSMYLITLLVFKKMKYLFEKRTKGPRDVLDVSWGLFSSHCPHHWVPFPSSWYARCGWFPASGGLLVLLVLLCRKNPKAVVTCDNASKYRRNA